MSKTGKLTLKIFLAVVLNDFLDGIAQVLMKKGLVETIGFPLGGRELVSFIVHNAASPLMWAGIFLYALNFFLWIGILSHIDLSLAIPLGSTAYFVIPLLAMVFLHEKIKLLQWAGILLIVAGMYVLSKSKSLSPPPRPVP